VEQVERLGLSPATIQSDHELTDEIFATWMLRDQ
jgi:hypothetical protein